MGLNQAKLRPGSHQIKNIVKMSPIGSHTTKNVANWVLHNQKPVSRPDKQVEEKEKPQVRGCRTLVQRGTGRQDSPGRGDGLGWTTSTPPDSNGVPRGVPNSPELCTHTTSSELCTHPTKTPPGVAPSQKVRQIAANWVPTNKNRRQGLIGQVEVKASRDGGR